MRIDGVKEKLDRASHHFGEVRGLFFQYMETKEFGVTQDAIPEGYVARVSLNYLPPIQLALIIGDWVQNLRAALDIASCALAESEYDINPIVKKIQFKFEPDRDSKKEPYQLLEPDFERAREVGGSFLGIVSKLSNQDKHRLLLPVIAGGHRVEGVRELSPGIGELRFAKHEGVADWHTPFADGELISTAQWGNGMQFTLAIRLEENDELIDVAELEHVDTAARIACAAILQGISNTADC